MRKNMRKTLQERAEAIFDLLKRRGVLYKSDLKEIGIDAHSASKWIDLIQFIQSQPKLIEKTAGRYTTIELESSK